jgi:hypothetical protein
MALTAVPEKFNVPTTLGDEAKKHRELSELGNQMTTTGQATFTSVTSGTTYDTDTGTGVPAQDTYIINKGQQGLLYWLNLDTVLGTYNLNKVYTDILTTNTALLGAITDGASGADQIGATPIISGGSNTVQGILDQMFSRIYPIGSIYMSVNSANPSTLFGGTWSAWGTGRVPVGIDAGQTEFDTVEETGGAKTVTLSQANLPDLTLDVKTPSNYNIGMETGSDANHLKVAYSGTVAATSSKLQVKTGGSGTAVNNLQPYITCYMFKRTA